MPRHGNVPRTPVSRRDPAALVDSDRIAPPAPAPNPFDHATISEILHQVAGFGDGSSVRSRRKRQAATGSVLTWLQTLPSDTWQDRWLLGGDGHEVGWVPDVLAGRERWTFPPGNTLVVDGMTYLRTGKPTKRWQPTALLLQPVNGGNGRFDAQVAEHQRFRTWAGIQVLHRTGMFSGGYGLAPSTEFCVSAAQRLVEELYGLQRLWCKHPVVCRFTRRAVGWVPGGGIQLRVVHTAWWRRIFGRPGAGWARYSQP
jgi:hypothetical protein